MLRIWNRDAQLQYTSEYVPGLESFVSWRPSGNLIAASQHSAKKHDIIFFEKNGLRHGEFTLLSSPAIYTVEKLLWSCDSTVLLVFQKHLELKVR